ncbi:hypothetical protein L0Y65_01765 [Candidatus Micrarchaeota archaeon]|nr:hypothetical protein [Candidatus Micrarchaeota archaeon]
MERGPDGAWEDLGGAEAGVERDFAAAFAQAAGSDLPGYRAPRGILRN